MSYAVIKAPTTSQNCSLTCANGLGSNNAGLQYATHKDRGPSIPTVLSCATSGVSS